MLSQRNGRQYQKNSKDAYDLDPTTVSMYDDMRRHYKNDYFEEQWHPLTLAQQGQRMMKNLAVNRKDNLDGDENTVSDYDAMRMTPREHPWKPKEIPSPKK